MKKYLFFLLACCMLVISCNQEIHIPENSCSDSIFTAGFEHNGDTRTYIDRNFNLYWSKDDCVSVFSNTYNEKYVFNGETGDNSGTFSKVASDNFSTGNDLSGHYSIYPYRENTKITYDEVITYELPRTQTYNQDSFGEGTNVMLAATADLDDRFLYFKNVCGFLKIKLYGNIMVSEIEFYGNNMEKVSGEGYIVGSNTTDPVISMSSSAFSNLILECPKEGVAIGADEDNATSFWFVLPPTDFTSGITLIIRDVEGNEYILKSDKEQCIKRNVCLTLPAKQVVNNNLENSIELEDGSKNNCLIVSHEGYFKFPIGSYQGDSAFVLWNENGESDITNVLLNDGYIYFRKNNFTEGNAVISLKSGNDIVWSWHIWSTDVPRNIEVNGTLWMDRNLGATSTTPGDPDVYGLAYNPGNPFPFPGPKYKDYKITTTPSVPEGWYVADGYGFYKSNSIPKPSQPMQLCSNDDAFGASKYFTSGYRQGPKGYAIPGYSLFQGMIGYEPTIVDNGVYAAADLYIPCIISNDPSSNYSKYLCIGIYNRVAVATYALYFYNGISKMYYCEGAALMPARCYSTVK